MLSARDGLALRFLRTVALAAVALGGAAAQATEPLPTIEMFVPSPCLACIDYAEHLRKAGFSVTLTERDEAGMAKVKRWLNVPSAVESRQTAKIGSYFIEGHVPAEDILQLLKEQPLARGLAVPGLPRGAPGRENSNPTCETACTMLDRESGISDVRRELFDTLLVGGDGKARIWARH